MRRRRTNISNNGGSNDDKNYDFSPSTTTILTSRYGHESAKLIHVIERNLLLIMAIIVAMAVLSILNTLGVLEYLEAHNVDYIVDVTISVVLVVVVLAPLIILLLKSRTTLDRWTDMFERNTIITTMSIAMKNRTKEEAILALPQSILQIGDPLQEYIDSKRNDWSRFLNIAVDGNLVFDVLLDADHVLNNDSADNLSNTLKRVLKEYGAIVIDIIDGDVDRHSVELFTDSLSRYNTMTNNQIGLGLIIGENVTEDARQYAMEVSSHHKRKKREINLLIVMAKPSSSAFTSPTQEPEQTSAI
jgi:hypothetical protein